MSRPAIRLRWSGGLVGDVGDLPKLVLGQVRELAEEEGEGRVLSCAGPQLSRDLSRQRQQLVRVRLQLLGQAPNGGLTRRFPASVLQFGEVGEIDADPLGKLALGEPAAPQLLKPPTERLVSARRLGFGQERNLLV